MFWGRVSVPALAENRHYRQKKIQEKRRLMKMLSFGGSAETGMENNVDSFAFDLGRKVEAWHNRMANESGSTTEPMPNIITAKKN